MTEESVMTDPAYLFGPARARRPNVMARQHVVVSGHYYASLAGLQILEAGGNAIDAGVATGLAIDVLESEFVGFGGVAPAMIHLAERDERHVISGVGVWPQSADLEFFHKHHGGRIPEGLLHSVVPAAPSIWITALARFGTMSFGEVAAAAIRFARDGFPTYPFFAEQVAAGQLQALAQHRGDLPARRQASSSGRDLRAERSRSHAAIHGGPGAGACVQ
jgi:gamma-glutamyltranspeptidase / glutathione hydrolase